MPLQVVEGARERRPGPWLVSGMQSVMLGLPRSNRGESIVVVEHLYRAIEVPMVCGAQGGVEDATVFIDGDGASIIGTQGYRNVPGIAACINRWTGTVQVLRDRVRAVAIGERERGP